MRWEQLFDDLEAQLASGARVERAAEVADRTRRDRATRDLRQRLVELSGCRVTIDVAGGGRAEGDVLEVGSDWVLLCAGTRTTLVPIAATGSVAVRSRQDVPVEVSALSRRLGLGHALRLLSRDRAPVRVVGVDGRTLTGTIDAVGADLLDLSEHPLDVPRRRAHVSAVRMVPFAALAMVVRGG